MLFIAWFLRHFCTYFNTDNDYYAVTIMKGNFDGSCKTSYNVLNHSHRDWIELCLSEDRVGGGGLVVYIRGGGMQKREVVYHVYHKFPDIPVGM